MARIKMIRTAMVGKAVQKKGAVVDADDEEAKALVTAGYAKDHKGEAPDKNAELAGMLDGTVADVTARLEGMSKADLKALSKLEAKGSARVTLIAAIDAAAESAE